jgi:hypothetical protein
MQSSQPNELLIKNLQERSMEKRSQAIKHVQNEIEEYVAKNDVEAIKRSIQQYTKLT